MESVPPIRRRSFLGTGKINEVHAEKVGKMWPGKIAYSKVENMGNLMGVYPVENPTWQAGFSPANSMEKSTN